MIAPCRPLWAAVCAPSGLGEVPAPIGGSRAILGHCTHRFHLSAICTIIPIFAPLIGGRKWCRIKRWHHRSSHRPATRVGDARKQRVCGGLFARFVGYDHDIIFTPPLPALALPLRKRLENKGFVLAQR